jgi:Cytochrome P450
MTTTFSSGKIKGMMPTLTTISEDFVAVLNEAVDAKQCLNYRDFSSRYMCEIIGQVAFGLECNFTYALFPLNVLERNVFIFSR